ncbi:MAG: type I-E CRISPR-associated endoribonuclease Cas2e [Cyanobacteriota bacterium]|uniref:Type I-E CRISPR-associated endoribonuclease Cas2 n=1 Tax=Thermostichus vulcanus str. 'Rupite' TaxID=2813851 RepID=A0ABT0CFP8_THEVL|nr:type I-E CRISPR-associated endoribonuclease Cas2e [Thermostichus vulcanus]MCJ2544591.1 type I-E CRISPR-associated endoribonuclease Cas2 [Thermostichus vulcanus str. 'Rupite']
MVVFVLENVPASLRGDLSRWLFEVKAGVFTGRVSALVRDELWARVTSNLGNGSVLMLYSTNSEQGFWAKSIGDPSRQLVDIEGVLLVKTH